MKEDNRIRLHSEIPAHARVFQGVAVDTWIPASQRSHCAVCTRRFTPLRWKKHCRVCGSVICRNCQESRYVQVPLAGIAYTTACTRCTTTPAHSQGLEPVKTQEVESNADTASEHSTKDHKPRQEERRWEEEYLTGEIQEDALTSPKGSCHYKFIHTRHLPQRPIDQLVNELEHQEWLRSMSMRNSSVSEIRSKLRNILIVREQNIHRDLHFAVQLAADVTNSPAGRIVLLNHNRMSVIASIGEEYSEREESFFKFLCVQTVLLKQVFSLTQPGTSPKSQLFIAGAPIFNEYKEPVGSVIVSDIKSRPDFKTQKMGITLRHVSAITSDIMSKDPYILKRFDELKLRKVHTPEEKFLDLTPDNQDAAHAEYCENKIIPYNPRQQKQLIEIDGKYNGYTKQNLCMALMCKIAKGQQKLSEDQQVLHDTMIGHSTRLHKLEQQLENIANRL